MKVEKRRYKSLNFTLFLFSEVFINLHRRHDDQAEQDDADHPEDPVQSTFKHHQKYNSKEDNGGQFVPQTELDGAPLVDALCHLPHYFLADEVVCNKPYYKSELYVQPGHFPQGRVKVQHGCPCYNHKIHAWCGYDPPKLFLYDLELIG